jgi:hypothetical protein
VLLAVLLAVSSVVLGSDAVLVARRRGRRTRWSATARTWRRCQASGAEGQDHTARAQRAQLGRPGQRVFVLAEAIQFASRNGADAMNLSLGSSRESDLLENMIKEDDDDGDSSGRDAIFAAAGNENTSASRYPAAEDGALTVTLVDQERKKSSFANYGGLVDAT